MTRDPIDPAATKPETLTVRGPEGMKARLKALADQRTRAGRGAGVEVTAASLVRGAVLKMLDEEGAK